MLDKEVKAFKYLFHDLDHTLPSPTYLEAASCFLSKHDGYLFGQESGVKKARRSFADIWTWRIHSELKFQNKKRNIHLWKQSFILKTYKNSAASSLYLAEDFKREVLYGGLLTKLRPDLFAGVTRYVPREKMMIIPRAETSDGYQYLVTQPPPVLGERKLVALNLITAVKELHALGFLHNDIKAENTVVHKDTLSVKLIDFEHTTLICSQSERTKRLYFGTYACCVPLLYIRSPSLRTFVSAWTDIYATTTTVLLLLLEISLSMEGDEDANLSQMKDTHHIIEHSNRQAVLRAELRSKREQIDREFAEVLEDIIAFEKCTLKEKYKSPEQLWRALWEQVVRFQKADVRYIAQ